MIKFFGLLLILAFSSACVTSISQTHEQQCATRGMYLQGVSVDNLNTVSYNQKIGLSNGFARGESAICIRPESPQQNCEVKKHSEALAKKHEFNDTVTSKNLLLGIGYLAWVIPGVGLYFYYDSARDETIEQSVAIESSDCKSNVAH